MNRQPIDPTIPSDVYSSPELGTVVSVQRLDNSGVIMGAPNTIYVVNHYAPAQLVRYENWGDHLRIYINSYILGTINNVGLCILSAQGTKEHQSPPDVVVRSLGQKFLAERLLLHSESEIGRVLFLESVMVADPPLRRVLTAKEFDDGLLAASNALNHICADFITFHELGHAGKVDDRYAPFAQQTVASLDELPDFDFWKGDDRNPVKSEMCWIICLDAAPPRWVSRGRFVPRILRSVRL